MAYRTFEPTYIAAEEADPVDDGFAFFHGLINSIIPSLLGWMVIGATWYAIWCALP